jgi:DNA-nicking Smr family endonuclease
MAMKAEAEVNDRREPSRFDEANSLTRMAYVADLILELRDMVTAEGHATLAGLLTLAHAEALSKCR